MTPGPDLVYFTGYSPIAITERITMLAIGASGDLAMIVPILERPDAETAPGAPAVSLNDWTDGDDPYQATAKLLDERGRYAISDSAWAMHVLGLQQALPESSAKAKSAQCSCQAARGRGPRAGHQRSDTRRASG